LWKRWRRDERAEDEERRSGRRVGRRGPSAI
jgi:hypothetical protein